MSPQDPKAIRVYRFQPEARLDPVTVYVEEYGVGASRIIVRCYTQAWTAWWGSHGAKVVEEFIVNNDPTYVADALHFGNCGLMKKAREHNHYEHLLRIARAMQEHFKSIITL